MVQLLSTKFFIPSMRQELVPRARLLARLNEGLHGKLTLISAPAGFGKTTLVSEWVHDLRQSTARAPVAHLRRHAVQVSVRLRVSAAKLRKVSN